MPNGDPHFDLAYQDAWFAPITQTIVNFARKYNLLVDKYYHDAPSWDLRFRHPRGGNASVSITNYRPETAKVASVWYMDDYDAFTRSLHWRAPREVPKTTASIAVELHKEFKAILRVRVGDWNQVADGFERLWSRYSKEEFEAMLPHYPTPDLPPEWK